MRLVLPSLALLWILAPSAALAQLVERDWTSAGDGLLSYDPVTGLEWLDWSLTANRSYDDVSGELGVGGEFEGFRHASDFELFMLGLDAGFTFGGATPADLVAAGAFIDLFGATLILTDYRATQAMGEDLVGGTERRFVSVAEDTAAGTGLYAFGFVPGFGDDETRTITGHALVRSQPAVVPLPLAAAIGIGVGILCRARLALQPT